MRGVGGGGWEGWRGSGIRRGRVWGRCEGREREREKEGEVVERERGGKE